MSSGADIELIRETYEKMSDAEITRVLTQDVAGLTPESLEIVNEEVKRRNLNPNIIKGINAQQKTYTIAEIDTYCDIIRSLQCPVCATTSEYLNGTMTADVVSYIFVTTYTRKLKVACSRCLDKANNDALIRTSLLGWWGAWGIIRTVQSIALNIKHKKTNHDERPNKFLRSFALSKIGQLETYKNDKEKLQEIISGD